MEKNNEKKFCPYVAPETLVVKIGGDEVIMQGIVPGSKPGSTGF